MKVVPALVVSSIVVALSGVASAQASQPAFAAQRQAAPERMGRMRGAPDKPHADQRTFEANSAPPAAPPQATRDEQRAKIEKDHARTMRARQR